MLSTSDYQNIVNRVVDILGKNINIMNTQGIIIASGDDSRIGTFHQTASIAAAENKEIAVDSEHASILEGVKPGINLPINFNSEVIGVVGITGNPEDVAGYGKIIKELVEMMVQENQRKKLELFQYRAVRNLIMELIKKSDFEPNELRLLESRATLVGFDLKKERVLLIADIAGFNDFIVKNALSEVKIQEIKQDIINYIAVNSDSHDVVFNLNEDRFIILKTPDHNILDFFQNKHNRIFSRLGVRMIFSISYACTCIQDYHNAYVMATNLLYIANKLGNLYVISRSAFDLYLLLHELPGKTKLEYMQQFGEIFISDKSNILTTVKVFFECGMNMKEASAKLFIHKNTLIYRLNKFKTLHGIDPLNPYQCMKIYLAIIMNQV